MDYDIATAIRPASGIIGSPQERKLCVSCMKRLCLEDGDVYFSVRPSGMLVPPSPASYTAFYRLVLDDDSYLDDTMEHTL